MDNKNYIREKVIDQYHCSPCCIVIPNTDLGYSCVCEYMLAYSGCESAIIIIINFTNIVFGLCFFLLYIFGCVGYTL